jgi:outer membrane protein assembly factor BamB
MYEETMQPVWQATFSSHIQNTTHVHKTRLYLDRMTEDVVVAASSYGSVLSAFDYRTGALLWERTFHSNDRVAWYAHAAQLVSATQNDTCTNVSITKFCPL